MFSCEKKEGAYIISTNMTFQLVDENGTNYLTKENAAVEVSKFKQYYINSEGKKVLQNSLSNGFSAITEDMGEPYNQLRPLVHVNMDGIQQRKSSKNYIDWGNNIIDTLDCQYVSYNKDRAISLSKITINGRLLWEGKNFQNIDKEGRQRMFIRELTKEGAHTIKLYDQKAN